MLQACLIVAMLLASIASGRTTAYAQANFDRPGGDYQSTPVLSGDPTICATMCERDRKCRAWSFHYPGSGAEKAVCWLKNSVTPRVENPSSVSGVRGAGVVERRDGKVESFTDRPGGDYQSFDTSADDDGAACRTACEQDDKCRAWSYARPSYAAQNARCFLKNQVKAPRRKPGVMSGVVR